MISVKPSNAFTFKQFTIKQDICTMKVNTDGVLLGAWADVDKAMTVLDIGSGTGVIALMIAQRNQDAKIIGIDIDHDSCVEARENVENSLYKSRVEIIEAPIQEYSRSSNLKFDLLVSNPPFFTGGTFSANENKANVRHAIKLPHGDLLNSVNNLISSNGNFSLILPFIEGLRFIELAERTGLHLSRITEVRHKPSRSIERLLINLSKSKPENVEKSELLIKEEDGVSYTNDFKMLTKDFYQHF